MSTGVPFPGVKRPGQEMDHSLYLVELNLCSPSIPSWRGQGQLAIIRAHLSECLISYEIVFIAIITITHVTLLARTTSKQSLKPIPSHHHHLMRL